MLLPRVDAAGPAGGGEAGRLRGVRRNQISGNNVVRVCVRVASTKVGVFGY